MIRAVSVYPAGLWSKAPADAVVLDFGAAARPLPPMWGSFGQARTNSSVTFVSKAAIDNGLAGRLGVEKTLIAVENTRGGIGKHSMIHNSATPHIDVDPETYEVRADGELLTCEPADVLPMAQRYFLF